MSGYIGNTPIPQATQTRDSFTATASQTSFATGGYTPNFLDVYLNGLKLNSSQFTATNGTDVVLTSAASANDIVEVIAYTAFEVADASFDDLALGGDLTVGGTVDGRDIAADGTKLDGIESGATGDQTNAEIRAAVEAATDSNVFTDADHTKLNAIEASATADQTAAEIRTLVESATDSNVFTDADHTKLNAIESGATADQTKSDIDALNINADTLDGQHGSYYTGYADTAVANIVDSAPGTLDTLNELAAALGDDPNFATTTANNIATKLPLAGGTMTGHLSFNDTKKAIFGTGSDFRIYHDGNNSYIEDVGDGILSIDTNGSMIQLVSDGSGANGKMAEFIKDGAVKLYYDNNLKLATTSTGIDVTGTVTADGINSSGNFVFTAADGMQITAKESVVINIDSDDNDSYRSFSVTSGSSTSLEYLITATEDSGVSLYHDNAAKIATTSTGINVTGTAVMDGLTVDGGGSRQYINSGHLRLSDSYNLEWGGGTNAIQGSNASNLILLKTNGSERMRIDSSGNLLVGKNSIAFNTDGFEARAGSHVTVTSSGGTPLLVNRKTSDGDIIKFYKDGSTVGSIGTANSGDLYIGNDDTTLLFAGGSDAIIPRGTAGATRDGAIDLGLSSHRFKDAHLSGLAYTNKVVTQTVFREGADGSGLHFTTNAIYPTDQTSAISNGTESLGASGYRFKDLYLSGSIANPSGNLTLDASGIINLDADNGGNINLKDGGTHYGTLQNENSDLRINSIIQDKDIIFRGNDGGTGINALTLDMSSGGRANFNNDISLNDGRVLRLGDGDDTSIYNDGSHFNIVNTTTNQDILFKGNDDGSNITALTLDMSNAGKAIFNNGISSSSGHVSLGSSSWADDILYLTRSNDGKMQRFFRGTTEVCSIGTSGLQSYIHGASGQTGLYWGTNNIFPYRSTGLNHNTIDLGQSNYRFKDGYFSGSLYGDGSNLTGVGGSTTAGAVGTYALLWRPSSTTNNFGDTLAGSNLRVANTFHNGIYNNFGYGSTSVSGTWRCMGDTGAYNGSSNSNEIWLNSTIWVRIS
jgi:hypothetical protein